MLNGTDAKKSDRNNARQTERDDNLLTMPPDLAGLNGKGNNSAANIALQGNGRDKKIHNDFVGTSAVMLNLYDHIESAARSQATIFITGETGTGKELCAEAIHKLGSRAKKPFIPVNCAAIPRDLMESELFGHIKGAFTGAIADRDGAASLADGGTLFLDEIAEMNPDMQTKLLRFLQNRTFTKVGSSRMEQADVRIICATNRDPVTEIRAGKFREDLFYRLHVLPLHMPPLRQRGEDIIDIAQILLRRYTDEENKSFTDMSTEAENILRRYKWPGNIRELQNVIRQAVVMHDGDIITARMLPDALRFADDDLQSPETQQVANDEIRTLEANERGLIEEAIRRCHGNIHDAAARLGISPSTIYRKKTLWEKADTP